MSDEPKLADELADRLARGEPWVMEDWPDGTPANDRPLVERAVEALREADRLAGALERVDQTLRSYDYRGNRPSIVMTLLSIIDSERNR